MDRFVFYGVRMLGRERLNGVIGVFEDYDLGKDLIALIGTIEPRRFVRIFPVEKTYRGERFGIKDYFTTMQMIESHGWDKPIGNAVDFLWDYVNRDITEFMVSHLERASIIRRSQGQPGILEEWARENGIPLYLHYTDESGRQFLMDDNGRTYPVKKASPRHLKVIGGKKREQRHQPDDFQS